MHESLANAGALKSRNGQLEVTDPGRRWFAKFGVDMDALEHQKRVLCRTCLDWSERRNHLAGGLGKALLDQIQVLGWAKRERKTRILRFSVTGERALRRALSSI